MKKLLKAAIMAALALSTHMAKADTVTGNSWAVIASLPAGVTLSPETAGKIAELLQASGLDVAVAVANNGDPVLVSIDASETCSEQVSRLAGPEHMTSVGRQTTVTYLKSCRASVERIRAMTANVGGPLEFAIIEEGDGTFTLLTAQ